VAVTQHVEPLGPGIGFGTQRASGTGGHDGWSRGATPENLRPDRDEGREHLPTVVIEPVEPPGPPRQSFNLRAYAEVKRPAAVLRLRRLPHPAAAAGPLQVVEVDEPAAPPPAAGPGLLADLQAPAEAPPADDSQPHSTPEVAGEEQPTFAFSSLRAALVMAVSEIALRQIAWVLREPAAGTAPPAPGPIA
jgi:hypothetical protein